MITGQASRRPAGRGQREAKERRREKIIENFRTVRPVGRVQPVAEDVLAGRLAIKQRARAKYLHKSVLPCAAREELILHPHTEADTHTHTRARDGRTRARTRAASPATPQENDVTRVEICSLKRKCRCPPSSYDSAGNSSLLSARYRVFQTSNKAAYSLMKDHWEKRRPRKEAAPRHFEIDGTTERRRIFTAKLPLRLEEPSLK